jgi:hypothetical protein
MCAIAGVTRSGYYRYLSNIDEISVKEQRDYADFLLILEA